MEQYVGQTLGRYSLSSLLGEGSMGAVFKAQDTTLKRQVAVKIMRPDMAVQPDFRDRFLQEARTEAQLTHPNIVQVYDFGQEGDTLYIVMEFLNGKNLEEHFNELRTKGEWLDLAQTLEITRQLALALHYAHRQGILHRDIKPVNVFLTPVEGDKIPYRPILTDVGLAKLATGGVVTMVGVSLGTPAYMSPETALGKDTEPRSDLYSLGVLLFQMATQQLPFPANNLFDAMKYHGKEPPPSPRSISKDIPESLDKCILKLLEKDPQNRPADASSLAKELESILEEIQKPVLPARPEVDMSTRIQVDGLDERDQSILTEFSKAKEPPRDCIKIHSGGEVIKMHTIKTDKMVIGRALETDIVLNDAKVSREHARIEFDGSNYRVIDQGSTNGTFMGDARLLPGVPEPWTPDKVLHIGDFYLHLERSEVILPAKPPVDATYISSAEPHQEPVQSRPAGQGSIDITMEKSLLTVEPGQTIQLIVTLANQGSLVEHLKTSVDGIPANWIPTPPPTIQLMPGDQQEMSIAVQPPRSPKGRAGDYPIKVQVTTRDGRDHAEVDGVLKVLSFSQFTSELHPQKIRAGKAGRVRIQNKGNAPETYNLNWQDRAVELDFQPPQARIQVQEGQADTAEFRAAPRQRRLLGGQQTHPITVQVAASSGTPQTLTGEVISKALIPPWIIPVVLVLCVLLAAAAALLTPPLIIHPRETQAAIAASETAAAGTQIALSDPDSDGLNNAEEANIGTNPENSDTDDDGLKDGAEVKQHGTDPKNKDSDQDTLLDGAEVSGGCTSPKNPDSDGDSLPDNVDSNPCMLPTETPKPTLTPTPTQTPTPTTTPTPTPQPYIACPGLYQSRIHVGDFAFVSEDPPTANRVRKDHDTSAEILGFIQPGEKVEILEGPFCGEWIWWKVRSMESGLVGWTAEGDSKNYWLVPMSK